MVNPTADGADRPALGILLIVAMQTAMIGLGLAAKTGIVPLIVLTAVILVAALAGFRALVSHSHEK